jgi:hypothetical protein
MRFTKKTIEKMEKFKQQGFKIIVGNNPFMNKTQKWENHYLILLAHTNSRTHGFCVRTVWAVKQKEEV